MDRLMSQDYYSGTAISRNAKGLGGMCSFKRSSVDGNRCNKIQNLNAREVIQQTLSLA